MDGHAFGGDWTEKKLERVTKYLVAYRSIFERNKRAQYFKTWYVDAFAGTGSRLTRQSSISTQTLLDDVYQDADADRYREGSVRRALGLKSPFDKYLFIEKSKSRVEKLSATLGSEYPILRPRCLLKHQDANDALKVWSAERDWKRERAVVFLDPYGMQVRWETIAMLGATEAVDLWYLFPLGAGVLRLLTRDGNIDEAWRKRLDLVFGSSEWWERFYQTRSQPDLFDSREIVERSANVESIKEFVQERLKTCFAAVAEGRVLQNSKSYPLYLLCFAAANRLGAPTALRIAQHILDH